MTIPAPVCVPHKVTRDAQPQAVPSPPATPAVVPPPSLENGDRLSRHEFERRYRAMPHVKKAELVEGAVTMPSPVHQRSHSRPHSRYPNLLGV